jgi:phosphatidylethanolamine-binding protein (PEBP) family uncharacterized protein
MTILIMKSGSKIQIRAGAKKMAIMNLLFICFFFFACEKDDDIITGTSEFRLSSPEIGTDSLLPIDYTCDGESATLPLEWTGAPDSTVSFAIIMHHEASPTDVHWYWVLYNIPATVNSLCKNITGVGTLGTNSVNDQTEYAPPCSQGPGIKAYSITIYALSQFPTINYAPDEVTREVLLNTIESITLSKASITVYYIRDIK